MVAQMVGVGEETGALDTMLAKIADFYDDEVEAAVKALTSIMEPVMIIFVGGIVGFIVISMYLPLFTVYDSDQVAASRSSIQRPGACGPLSSAKVIGREGRRPDAAASAD